MLLTVLPHQTCVDFHLTIDGGKSDIGYIYADIGLESKSSRIAVGIHS
jgi:hypothetical protein